MNYELKLEQYQGPFEKLLELIEEKKLEINDISLAKVTDDFLRYLEELKKAGESDKEAVRLHLRTLADFIALASRLLLIKSKSLLPAGVLTADEEAEIKDLEERLKLYQEFKPARRFILKLWNVGKREFSRPYFLNLTFVAPQAGVRIFEPGSNLSLDILKTHLEIIFESFRKLAAEEETLEEEIVSIEEKIREIISRIEKFGELTFGKLADQQRSRREIIAVFLAVLHLAHEQRIFLEQKRHFSDIIIKRSE